MSKNLRGWIRTIVVAGQATAVAWLALGCASRSIQPRKAGDWMVELTELQVGAADFNLSVMGEPLEIEIAVVENGRALKPSGPTRLSGRRGQRVLENRPAWLVHFDPARTYQVVLEERAIIAHTAKWELPPTPRLREWPFAGEDGMLRFGKESYLKFSVKRVRD